MSTRKNQSRARELDIVVSCFVSEKEILKNYLNNNPKGGIFWCSNMFFHFGNIERILDYINWEITTYQFPFKKINGIYHLDGLSSSEKSKIEKENKLQTGLITIKSKADLLIISEGNPILISYKDGTKASKLGQVSTEIRYNSAVLRGGLILPFYPPVEQIELNIESRMTKLTDSQFDKLKYQDKLYAYYKAQFNVTWMEYVDNCMKEAVDQLLRFGNIISTDKYSFIDFLKITLFGRVNIPSNFNILINEQLISSDKLFSFLENNTYVISTEIFSTKNKFSLIINLIVNKKKYVITKIEPAFDGSKPSVSQTKGIIYYFQQYPKSGDHIWRFLKDISE